MTIARGKKEYKQRLRDARAVPPHPLTAAQVPPVVLEGSTATKAIRHAPEPIPEEDNSYSGPSPAGNIRAPSNPTKVPQSLPPLTIDATQANIDNRNRLLAIVQADVGVQQTRDALKRPRADTFDDAITGVISSRERARTIDKRLEQLCSGSSMAPPYDKDSDVRRWVQSVERIWVGLGLSGADSQFSIHQAIRRVSWATTNWSGRLQPDLDGLEQKNCNGSWTWAAVVKLAEDIQSDVETRVGQAAADFFNAQVREGQSIDSLFTYVRVKENVLTQHAGKTFAEPFWSMPY